MKRVVARPGSGASDIEPDKLMGLGMIPATASWCDSLHGKKPLGAAPREIAEALSAEIIAVSRSGRDQSADGGAA